MKIFLPLIHSDFARNLITGDLGRNSLKTPIFSIVATKSRQNIWQKNFFSEMFVRHCPKYCFFSCPYLLSEIEQSEIEQSEIFGN